MFNNKMSYLNILGFFFFVFSDRGREGDQRPTGEDQTLQTRDKYHLDMFDALIICSIFTDNSVSKNVICMY